MKGVWLQDLTWQEAAERFTADPVVVVPVGAASKEHGPHLPLDTDHRYAVALAERAQAAWWCPLTLRCDGAAGSTRFVLRLACTPSCG